MLRATGKLIRAVDGMAGHPTVSSSMAATRSGARWAAGLPSKISRPAARQLLK